MNKSKYLISFAGLSIAASATVLAFRMEPNDLPSHEEQINANNQQIEQYLESANALMAQIDGDGRTRTAEEAQTLSDYTAEVENLQADNDSRRQLMDLAARQEQPQNRQTEAVPADDDLRETQPVQSAAATRRPALAPAFSSQVREQGPRGDVGMWGWDSTAKFMRAVVKARSGNVDGLLARKASVNSDVGIEGAYAVPPTVAETIMTRTFDTAKIASRCDTIDISGNRYEGVKDESEPYSNDGVTAEWLGAGQKIGKSAPKLEDYELKLDKLGALVPFTNEGMKDAAQMDSFVRTRVPEKMGQTLDAAVYAGDGVKKPEGMINSSAVLQVAKESGQAAGSVVYGNIKKLWTRVHAPNRLTGRGFWIANPDLEEQLMDLEFPGDGRPLYIPGNSVANQPHSMLFGREIFFSQHAPALGTPGDLGFFDPNEYFLIRKVGVNPKIDTSMHVYFEHDMSALRFVLRVTGQSKWAAPVTQSNSSVKRSCFVTIAERA